MDAGQGGVSWVPPSAASADAGVLAPVVVERDHAADAGSAPPEQPRMDAAVPPAPAAHSCGQAEDCPTDPAPGGCHAAPELCDDVDNDCDGRVDEGVRTTYYADVDHDGAGDARSPRDACAMPDGYTSSAGDCDDADATSAPDQKERCDGKDNDCDGQIDEAVSGAPSCAGAQIACRGAQGFRIIACGDAALDCDGDPSNCCEVPIGLSDCGACGNACAFACAANSCDEVAQLGLGADHSCAITAQGNLACWGRNDAGQRGVGGMGASARPAHVELVGPVYAVSGGVAHTCAIAGPDRQLFCWGSNADGQLGAAGVSSAAEPHPVQSPMADGPLLHVSQVSAGVAHSCAVLESGALYCWGQQANGRLGNMVSFAGATSLPQAVQREGQPVEDAVQVVSGSVHSCALLRDHSVLCWGGNGAGQLGDGSLEGETMSALMVPGLSAIESLAAGAQHTCALSAGHVFCWGANASGQLGRSEGPTDSPALVSDVSDAHGITAGAAFSCALDSHGGAVCWGSNASGELGDGGMQSSATPGAVQLEGIVALSAGSKHACARTERSTYCWGQSSFGQLGYETGTQMLSAMPQRVQPLAP